MEIKEKAGQLYYVTKYGRLGKRPTVKEKAINSIYAGENLLDDAYYKKRKKGYVITDMDEIIATGDEFFFS